MPDPRSILEAAANVALAIVLALPLGWVREGRSRDAGLRTYPLLSACVCGFLQVGRSAAWEPREMADAVYGVLSGISFVGSGAIMKSGDDARGMSTAVSLWVTGAIGAGVALGAALLSAALAAAILLTLWVPRLIALRARRRQSP